MILHIEDGRLGNQLFQYVGLKKYFPKENLFFLGSENFQKLFENIDGYFLFNKKIKPLYFYLIVRAILFLTKIRFVGRIYEDISSNYKINIKQGILWKIFISYNNYFQHQESIAEIKNPPVLKFKIRKKALEWFKEKRINLNKNKIVFVHIRRTDYLHIPSNRFPGVLNISWYKKMMNLVKKKIQNPIFVIMGDDHYYLQDCFKSSNTIFISENKFEIDLSIMTYCAAGILSPSSFAWWGAFYARKYNLNVKFFFIGPKYWLGHREKKWVPQNFYTNWITFIE